MRAYFLIAHRGFLVLTLILTGVAATAPNARAALPNLADPTWMTNGPVRAIAHFNNVIWVGGQFTELREKPPNQGGQVIAVSNLAAIDATTGAPVPGLQMPAVTGTGSIVYALTVAGGKLYIGGSFSDVGGAAHRDLAAIDAGTGALDTSFHPDIGVVWTLAADASRLYVGGGFALANGQPRNRLAAFDLSSGTQIWRTDTNGQAQDVAVMGNRLIVAGHFTHVAPQPGLTFNCFDHPETCVQRMKLAALTLDGQLDMNWDPEMTGDYDGVWRVLVNAPQLYAVGEFTHVSGVDQEKVARFTDTSAGPTVSAISPSSGTSSGGTAVTVTGTGFAAGATVSLGGTAATNVTVVSSTSLTATTAAHAAGVVNVVVTNSDGQSGTLTGGYTYTNPAPTVSAISPSSGTSSGGTAVTVTGTGFAAGATVSLVGTAATNVTVVSSTSLTATTAAHAAGAVDVVVTNSDGQSGTLTGGYTYTNPAPTVSAISPSSGTSSGGAAVTITGTGFAAGATVSLGGTAATNVTVVSSTSLTATTAAHAAGAVDVVVTNSDGQSGTLTGGYTYINSAQTGRA